MMENPAPHRGGYDVPTSNCPYCGTTCEADWCDVGVGMVQCGPFYCANCLASEIGSYDEPRPLSADEERTGWYAPGSEPGSTANVINGRIVSAAEAKDAYHAEFAGNSLYNEPGAVEAWWAQQREGK